MNTDVSLYSSFRGDIGKIVPKKNIYQKFPFTEEDSNFGTEKTQQFRCE